MLKDHGEQSFEKTKIPNIYERDVKLHTNRITLGEYKAKIKWDGNEGRNFDTKEGVENCIADFWSMLREVTDENSVAINRNAIYYAGDNPGTLFPDELKEWNLNRLTARNSVIHSLPKEKWNAVTNESVVFAGSKNSCFALHAEDKWLHTISYNHWGAPKIWYGIKRKHKYDLLEKVTGCLENNDCSNLLQHKSLLLPPFVLNEMKIEYSVVILLFSNFFPYFMII